LLRLLEAPPAARGEGESDLGELLGAAVRVPYGQAPAALVQPVGACRVAGEQGDPPQLRPADGRLAPQVQVLGEGQALPVPILGLPVVALDLGEPAEHGCGLEEPPLVTGGGEERQTLLCVPPRPG